MRCPTLRELPPPPRRRKGFPWTEETPPIEASGLPRMSIVTPSLNQGRFLEATIRSVLLQGYPDIEYMVFDGGSTDGSVDIMKKYERWITYWRSAPDNGQAAAINEGLARAAGEIVGWLNSDDRFLPGALNAVARVYMEDPGAVAYVGNAAKVDDRGRTLLRNEPRRFARDELADWSSNSILQPCCFFKRDAALRAGGLDEGLDYAFDFALWLSLASLGRFRKVERDVAEAAAHGEAKTQSSREYMIAEIAIVLMRRGYEDLAKKWLAEAFASYRELAVKARRLTGTPLYKLVRPLLRLLGLVGPRS